MKKFFLLATMGMMSISSYAQIEYDITIHQDPNWSDLGVKYQPTETPTRSVPDPYKISRQNRDLTSGIREQWDAEERAYEEGRRVVSENIQLLTGVNLSTKISTSIRAKVTTRKSGLVEMTCMGIKNGQSWKPCSKPIVSLQGMYNNAHSESEKSMILDLMDLGNYLLDTGNEMYVIK